MQKILIEVSHQDQVYVEEECTKKGYTLSGFFEKILNDYRTKNSELTPLQEDHKNTETEKKHRKNKKL